MSDLEQSDTFDSTESTDIAIIGMAGRFPGAKEIDTFWKNIRDRVEGISYFTEAELQRRGVSVAALNDSHYVRAGAVLEGVDLFDASFFGYSPKEAERIDPQQRLFLESAWEALEHAGYDPESYSGLIGVYAGTGMNTYLLFHLLSKERVSDLHDISSLLALMIGNDKDFLSTRVSYKLNLKGPSITVQTACSTSLVAVHLACQGLLNYQTDMALAGGVSINLLQSAGYRYQAGGILSPDGHCRAFDAGAAGTVIGSGVGVVVLKRRSDALKDGDTIHAIIKGSAVNNDGSMKVGYTAPSVEGQSGVIMAAQALAGTPVDSIGYIEAHGTGTTLGDPIEIAALTQAFQASTSKRGFCAIGSVKTNVGHLDAAAGIAGLIKTVLALKHRILPPSLHFQRPNPQIALQESPFFISAAPSEWKEGSSPRRAGVSSFGIGGTNAHVILEEAPPEPSPGASRPWQLLTLSAHTGMALEAATTRLRDHLLQNSDSALADIAYTLQVGRRHFAHRRAVVCRDREEALRLLEGGDPEQLLTARAEPGHPPVAFLFPGQGAQHINMALALFQEEPLFREEVDRCVALLKPHLGLNLQEVLYPSEERGEEMSARLNQTEITQPALFVIEYALARLWMAWGVCPEAMIGHSIGEYVAACLAGVVSLEDALFLVAARGRLLQSLPAGAMTAVALPAVELNLLLEGEMALAAVNGPSLSVLAGPTDAIQTIERRLTERGVSSRRLSVSHAFHSPMVVPILAAFLEVVKKVNLRPPSIPFLSNVSGQWIRREEAVDPDYWVRHLRQTVRFSEGLHHLMSDRKRILLEVGPGETLSTLAKRHPETGSDRLILSSLPHPQKRQPESVHLLGSLGRLWLAGVPISWSHFYDHERRRVPLPTYPFERQRYWVEPDDRTGVPEKKGDLQSDPHAGQDELEPARWFYLPSWKRAPLCPSDEMPSPQEGCWVILTDRQSLGSHIIKRLRQQGEEAVVVEAGGKFDRQSRDRYTMRPGERGDYDRLLTSLTEAGLFIKHLLHLWSVTPDSAKTPFPEIQARGFFSLLYLAQALAHRGGVAFPLSPIEITVVSNEVEEVLGTERLYPEKATLLGPCKVIPQEHPELSCRFIDVEIPEPDTLQERWLADQLLSEYSSHSPDKVIAYRGVHRWIQTFEPVRFGLPMKDRLRKEGVYLITGGLGGIGLALAEHLAKRVQAKLVLVGRSGLPPREQWLQWLSEAGASEEIGLKLKKLLDLEAHGSEVLALQADVSEEAGLRKAVSEAIRRFGAVHGIIHAAGVAGGGMISLKTADAVEKVFSPKIAGAQALQAVLKEITPDFVLFCSSLTAITGGFGQVDYCAANLFLDAVAKAVFRRSAFPILSINWDTWREVGMAAKVALPEALREIQEEHRTRGMSSQEGIRTLDQILSGPLMPQIIVSTADLNARIKQAGRSPLLQSLPLSSLKRERVHARPPLQTAYTPPQSELEQGIAEIWRQLLGIDSIGADDNFFELGGDSLLAIQLLSRIRAHFAVELGPAAFFDAPTIRGLASLIETKMIEEVEGL